MWIQNHFNDFEMNRQLYEFLEEFQDTLQRENMTNELRMITIAISTKSKPREITLARSKRSEQLPFEIKCGWDKGYGIYISKVDNGSKAHELGLRKGDQIIEVNGQLFQYLSYTQAYDILTTYTHLSIKVKYNPMAFNEMLLHPEKSPHRNKKNLIIRANNNFAGVNMNLNSKFNEQLPPEQQQPPRPPMTDKMFTPRSKSKEPNSNGSVSSTNNYTSSTSLTSTASKFTSRGFKFFDKFNKMSKQSHKDTEYSSAPSLKSITRSPSPSIAMNNYPSSNRVIPTSTSNNGISSRTVSNNNINNSIENLSSNVSTGNNNSDNSSSLSYVDSTSSSCIYDDSFAIEHVLKIYRNDQTFKYLVVHRVWQSLNFKISLTITCYFIFFLHLLRIN